MDQSWLLGRREFSTGRWGLPCIWGSLGGVSRPLWEPFVGFAEGNGGSGAGVGVQGDIYRGLPDRPLVSPSVRELAVVTRLLGLHTHLAVFSQCDLGPTT